MTCDRCGQRFRPNGGLLWQPINRTGKVFWKFHLCWQCTVDAVKWVRRKRTTLPRGGRT